MEEQEIVQRVTWGIMVFIVIAAGVAIVLDHRVFVKVYGGMELFFMVVFCLAAFVRIKRKRRG